MHDENLPHKHIQVTVQNVNVLAVEQFVNEFTVRYFDLRQFQITHPELNLVQPWWHRNEI